MRVIFDYSMLLPDELEEGQVNKSPRTSLLRFRTDILRSSFMALKLILSLVAMGLLCACQKAPTPATIDFGPGNGSWRECAYVGYHNRDGYGIFRLLAPNGLGSRWATTHVIDGAQISGNLSGFGDRTLHDDSNNTDFKVAIVFHGDSHDALLKRMKTLGCFRI